MYFIYIYINIHIHVCFLVYICLADYRAFCRRMPVKHSKHIHDQD